MYQFQRQNSTVNNEWHIFYALPRESAMAWHHCLNGRISISNLFISLYLVYVLLNYEVVESGGGISLVVVCWVLSSRGIPYVCCEYFCYSETKLLDSVDGGWFPYAIGCTEYSSSPHKSTKSLRPNTNQINLSHSQLKWRIFEHGQVIMAMKE